MGRKRTAEELMQAAAESGWEPGAHEEEDGMMEDPSTNGYILLQETALDQWKM